MLRITEEQIEKYRAIHLEETQVVIGPEQAREELTALVCLLETVYRHMQGKNWTLTNEGLGNLKDL